MVIKTYKLKELSKQTKEKLYKKLLSDRRYEANTTVEGRHFYYDFDIEFYNNDLCLSSWGLNYYTRTKKACDKKRYKSFDIAMRELKKLARKIGCKLDYITITKLPYIASDRISLYNIVL